MLTLTAEQVRTLAPDASAARSGEALGNGRRWTAQGRSDVAAWGLCQGSGSTPYQVAVDISGPAYKCSCPSRKIPCKHALGLMFLVADGGAPMADPPDWVRSWLDGRNSRAVAAATRAERTADIDPEARAKRIATRERKVAAGIDELDRWLRDLMRRGLDSTRSEGYRFWDTMGARLVDAQAGGLGRSVRGLASAANSGDAWPHLLLEGAGRLHLLCEAYRRSDLLPEDLKADVRSLVGWNLKEDELDPVHAVEDRWLVIGQRIDDRGDIVTARTFLLGEETARIGLHLAFGVGAAPPTLLAVPGQAFRATVTFYPSATPLRVAVRPPIVPDGEATTLPLATTLAAAVEDHAARLARNPFVGAWPVLLGDVVPVLRGAQVLVRDADGTALSLTADVGPRLLAISGGHPILLVAEWDGAWLRPLAAFADGRLASVSADVETSETKFDDPDWSALVSAALSGTERTGGTVPIPASVAGLIAGDDTERAILSAAASMAVRRRAGRTTSLDEAPMPAPAEADRRPQLTGSAARYVGLAFEERPSLAPEVLELVRTTGRRLPDEWVPDLMAMADHTDHVDPAVVELGGERAAWLARTMPALAGDAWWGTDEDWEEAWAAAPSGPARAALVRKFRQVDLARARQSLVAWWSGIGSEDRARILAAVETGLDPSDEPFLAQALEDRRADVRRTAARLLVLLPDSALTLRLEDAARPLLATGGLVRKTLKVSLPTPSEEFESLGFGGRPAPGYGERAWLLRSILAHIRPERWTGWLQVDAAGLIDQATRSDEARPLIEGWIDATARFGDAVWAAAILHSKTVPTKIMVNVGQVLDGLTPADRAVVVATSADAFDPAMLAALAAKIPAPWPRPVGDLVLAVSRSVRQEQFPAAGLYELVRAAALRLPPDRADELEAVASFKDELRPALADAIETIRLRARIHQAFAAVPPISG